MADCIVQLHCMTGCGANTGFYGESKNSVYDQVAKSPVARRQLSRCGESLNLEEEVVEQFTRHVYNKSSTMAEAREVEENEEQISLVRLPPDADSLRQHSFHANYLAHLMHHPSLKHHPSPWLGAGV